MALGPSPTGSRAQSRERLSSLTLVYSMVSSKRLLASSGRRPGRVPSGAEFPPACGCGRSRVWAGQRPRRPQAPRAGAAPGYWRRKLAPPWVPFWQRRIDVSLTSLPRPLPPSRAPGSLEAAGHPRRWPRGLTTWHHLPPSPTTGLRSQETDGSGWPQPGHTAPHLAPETWGTG